MWAADEPLRKAKDGEEEKEEDKKEAKKEDIDIPRTDLSATVRSDLARPFS